MIVLRPPVKSIESLRAIAASGSSGVAKRAQEQLRQAMHDALKRSVGQ